MKIEYLYLDNAHQEIIENMIIPEGVKKENSCENGLNIFSFSMKENDEAAAKTLSGINEELANVLDGEKLFILSNQASAYFNKRLYPLINDYERTLRKVLNVISIKEGNKVAIELARKLEVMEFSKIYNRLFTSETFIEKVLAKVKDKDNRLSKKDLLKTIENIEEKTLWGELFKNKYDEVSGYFLEIKKYRNDVMHAHNISYKDYKQAREIFKLNIVLLNEIANKVMGKDSILSERVVGTLLAMVNEAEKTNKIMEENFAQLLKSTSNNSLFQIIVAQALNDLDKENNNND